MRQPCDNRRGTITLVALCLTTVLAIALGSYIALCHQSLSHSSRLFNMDRARQLAETGLEQGLWALNNNDWTSASWGAAVDADADGSNDDRQKTFTGFTFDPGVSGQVVVKVLNHSANTPTIVATATVSVANAGTFTRTLTATTKPAPMFVSAIGISSSNNGRILFSNNGTVDSWNSDPDGDYNASTAMVTYPSPAPNHTAAANCAAVLAAPNITLNSATIYGYATTFGNSITTTSNSKVKGPTTGASTNIESDRVGKSSFVPLFTVAAPTGSYDSSPFSSSPFTYDSGSDTVTLSGSTTTKTLGTAGASTATQYSLDASLMIENSATLIINGPVVLRVNGDFTVQLAATIQITSTGRLEMFVSGDVRIGGAAGSSARFRNDTNEAKNLAIYSTHTGNRTFAYYTNQGFCGVLYSASTTNKIQFTSIPSSVSFNGAILANYHVEFDSGANPQLHYDTALQTLPKNWFKGVTAPFLILNITES